MIAKTRIVVALVLAGFVLTAGGTTLAVPDKPLRPEDTRKSPRRCIILWMSGGPSQIDTFDPKAGDISLFKTIDTNVKGLQLSATLPLLARQANHLAIIRSMTYPRAIYDRGLHLMRTGYETNSPIDHPSFACVLAKELGDDHANLPRYVNLYPIANRNNWPFGPGILGKNYTWLEVGPNSGFVNPPITPDQPCPLPPVEAFEFLDKANGAAMRRAVAKAFDFSDEKAELRDAYGRGVFGNGCLLARRLVERGVPVVEIMPLNDWAMRQNIAGRMPTVAGEMDAGMATLTKDLHKRRLLDSILIVWMGVCGASPDLSQAKGRDHWSSGFSVVLAGGGVKGGQAIGKTSANGLMVEAFPVTPPELLATIYTALGIDPHKANPTPAGLMVPLVERGNKAVQEALR